MTSTTIEIKLDRPSKTYLPGEKISGNVIISSKTTLKVKFNSMLSLYALK